MDKKRTSILSDLKRNYDDTKSISKAVDLSAIENKTNPHKIYNNIFKNVDKTPADYPTEKISEGDIVYMNDNVNQQYEVISINNKADIIVKNLSNNETIKTSEDNIKKIMENIDMAKKKINETQYSVSINGLETTDANALSQMMSAAAQADSGNADVGGMGMDMTSTPELPTPEMGAMDPAVNEPTDIETPMAPEMSDVPEVPTDSFEEVSVDEELPTDIENPMDNPEPEMDMSDDDFEMDSEMDNEPVVDDIEFDEEIEPTEDELESVITYDEPEIDDSNEIIESQLNESRPDKEDFINSNTQNVDENVLQELYEIICEQMGDDYLSDYDEVDHMELLDCVKDFGNDIEGFDEEFAEEYATALQEKWKEEHIDDGSDYEDYGRPNWEDEEDEEINEDILLPKESEDETYNASKKFKDDEEDEESERISESMDALIKSILETADAKSEQEVYAEEISESDEEVLDEASKNKLKHNGAWYEITTDTNENGDTLYYMGWATPRGINKGQYHIGNGIKLPNGITYENFFKPISDYEHSIDEKYRHELDELEFSQSYDSDESQNRIKEINNEKAKLKSDFIKKMLNSFNDEEILDEDDDFDSDIAECLKSAGIQLDEATVKPTIVTDESSFANKPNKALKPEDEKTVKTKTVDTATFGKDASEGFKEPLNCIKCEAVSPKEKIKAIFETARTRYAKADKSQWNALDRRYITKLIESGCGYTRASKIILEAKKKK